MNVIVLCYLASRIITPILREVPDGHVSKVHQPGGWKSVSKK
jgi:hypothetical protein